MSNLRAGSIKATVGFQMADIGQLDAVRLFGTKMNSVTWMGDAATVEGSPQLEVSYGGQAAQQLPGSALPVYTIHQVQDHNTELDCWMAVHGKALSYSGLLD